MADDTHGPADSSMSDDDISTNSSDSEEEEEYTVEEILAERLWDDSDLRYLVKWENYGEERCDLSIPVPAPQDLLLRPFCHGC